MAKKKEVAPKTQLAKLILDCSYRHRPEEYYRWMLGMLLWRFGLKPDKYYLPPKEEREEMTKIVTAYFKAVRQDEPFTDLLGSLYMELASHGHQSSMGQFFTPQPVAIMMAYMNGPNPNPNPTDPQGLWNVLDPTCGSGVMLLSWCQVVLKEYGPAALLNQSLTGIDLDWICAMTSAVQFIMNCYCHQLNVGEFRISQGNSLKNEGHKLIAHATYGGPRPVVEEPKEIEAA